MWHISIMLGIFKAEDILNFKFTPTTHSGYYIYTTCIIYTKFYIVALLIMNSSYFPQWHEEKQNTSFLGDQWAMISG